MTGWRMAPVVVLRQAGFALEILDPLGHPELPSGAAELRREAAELRLAATAVIGRLRDHDLPGRQAATSMIGMLRPLPQRVLDDADPYVRNAVSDYQARATDLVAHWQRWTADYRRVMGESRLAVAGAFRSDRLRDVLLLSNDAAYPELRRWLDAFRGAGGGHTRKMCDLLAMYLQRVATKNETHSHFGPVAVGRMDPDVRGIQWTAGHPTDARAYFSHWAAEELARAFSRDAALRDHVRPRRLPMAFVRDGRVDRYAFTTMLGFSADADFRRVDGGELTRAEQWLWERCDGEATRAELRAAWVTGGGDPDRLGAAVDRLAGAGWLVAEFEIPVGEPDPLRGLRAILDGIGTPAAAAAASEVDEFQADLGEFVRSTVDDRAEIFRRGKERFEKLTGVAASRGAGEHYADRAIFYEDMHSGLREVRIGRNVADFLAGELGIVYQVALAAPRLRLTREREVLRDWAGRRFRPAQNVPLDQFYAAFFADRDAIARECGPIEAEVGALQRSLTDALVGDRLDLPEVVVEPARVAEILAGQPAGPAAVCNPDVMIAAADRAALEAGRFTAVIGDLHAVREILTHTCFAPIAQDYQPDLLPSIHGGYQSLLDPDELLVDLIRDHPMKTEVQLEYPGWHLELVGRSPKPRSEVLQPAQLYVAVGADRLELRAHGVDGRLRLLAPLASGATIRHDPLAVFSFPRHFGDSILRVDHVDHLPRIRCGRVVLQRETWRVPAAEFGGRRLDGQPVANDPAADFYAACQLRDRLGLPRRMFAKVPGERKPLYLDWDAPLLVRQLFRMAGDTGRVELSEMLPDPDQRWLEIDGQRFTSELRCAAFSVA